MSNKGMYDLADLLSKRGEEVVKEKILNQPELFSAGAIRLSNGTEEEGRAIVNETTTSTAPGFYSANGEGRQPQYVLQQEKAHHRVICYELAMGKTAGEIAKEFGFTPAMVYYVEKQPWAKQAVANLIQQHGGDQVEKTLKGAALDAADLLVATVRDEQCDIKVRSQNAKEILDRIYGRSQQIVNHRQIEATDLTDQELAKLATAGTGGQ